MMSSPACPSTWLMRVSAATTPSRPFVDSGVSVMSSPCQDNRPAREHAHPAGPRHRGEVYQTPIRMSNGGIICSLLRLDLERMFPYNAATFGKSFGIWDFRGGNRYGTLDATAGHCRVHPAFH